MRKRIQETANDNVEMEPGWQIGKVHEVVGDHLFKIALEDGSLALCTLPSKFRNVLWVKRNSFVVVALEDSTTKIDGDIVVVLYKPQIKDLQKRNLFPKCFLEEKKEIDLPDIESSDSFSENCDMI